MPWDIDFSKVLKLPIITNTIYGSPEPDFVGFLAPGAIINVIFVLSMSLAAVMIVGEKREGLLERTFVAGADTVGIILAQISVKMVLILIQTIATLVLTYYLFGINIEGSNFLAGVLIFSQGFCGMSFGKNM